MLKFQLKDLNSEKREENINFSINDLNKDAIKAKNETRTEVGNKDVKKYFSFDAQDKHIFVCLVNSG